jgi:hypothetical protein
VLNPLKQNNYEKDDDGPGSGINTAELHQE